MQILKADTEVKVRIGPFVDKIDGLTPETGITVSGADEAELLKHNGAATVDISSNTWATITNCDGWYDLTLTAGNLDTEGLLTVIVQDDSICLPVFSHFMVVNANVYDSLFAGSTLFQKAAKLLVNKAVQNKSTGAINYYDDDGETIILTHTPADGESEITRTPS
jgi:hypothetical protein